MLPFTKRPGREETSDVVAKDDVAAKSSPAVVPPASSSRPTTMRPPASGAAARSNDFDDEMTGLRPPVSLQSPNTMALAAPIPAAGRPASIAPPRSVRPSVRPAAGGPASMTPASMRPPPASARSYEGDDEEDAEDEDGGRTVVRPEGAGKMVRRTAGQSQPPPRQTPSANPTSISPAAVIRKTMESQRSRGLASGPPAELRGDLDHENDEYTQTAAPSNRVDRTMNSNRSGAQRNNYPAPASYEGPPSHRPPPRSDLRSDETVGSRRNQYDSMDDDAYSQPPRSHAPAMRTYDAGPSSSPISSPMSGPRSQPPPSSARPGHFSNPPPSSYAAPPNGVNPHAATAAMSAVGTGGFHAMPQSGPNVGASVPPAAMSNNAMPAHFRMAQTGAIQGVGGMMADPPGTSVTSNTRVSGRPAMSWAAALAACGVFVGVVAVAIAQRGDSTAETQAAFVDPAHANKTAAVENPPTTPTQQPVSNPLPPGLIGASPVQAQPNAPPAMAPVPGMADPSLGALLAPAPPPAAAPAPPTTTTAEKEKPKAPKFVGVAPARPKPPAPSRPAAGDDDDDKPARPTKTTKASGKGSEADEETRRALEELRKAQLEQSLQK